MRKVVKARPRLGNSASDGAKALFLEAVRALRPEDIPVKAVDRGDSEASEPVARCRTERVVESIDLHGMTAEQAIRYLTEVLPDYRPKGGTVQIVVGKGCTALTERSSARGRLWLARPCRKTFRLDGGGVSEQGNGVIDLIRFRKTD